MDDHSNGYSYLQILIPPKDLIYRLKDEAMSPHSILEQVKYRADWQKHQEDQRRREEMLIEKERSKVYAYGCARKSSNIHQYFFFFLFLPITVAYAQIDWHDFVVVETVDYQMGEMGNFPPPTTPEEVGARALLQDRHARKKNNEYDDDEDENEMQMGSDDEMMDRTGKHRDDIESGDSDDDIMQQYRLNNDEAKSKDNTQVIRNFLRFANS